MNEPQTFFAFFYAVYFAIAATVVGKLHPFDTASMWHLYPRAWFRCGASLIFLDILPLLYFYFIYSLLDNVECCCQMMNYCDLLLLFFLSLCGQGFYRINYGLMLLRINGGYMFYDSALYTTGEKFKGLPSSLREDLNGKPESNATVLSHLGPGIIWVLVSFLVAWWLLR